MSPTETAAENEGVDDPEFGGDAPPGGSGAPRSTEAEGAPSPNPPESSQGVQTGIAPALPAPGNGDEEASSGAADTGSSAADPTTSGAPSPGTAEPGAMTQGAGGATPGGDPSPQQSPASPPPPPSGEPEVIGGCSNQLLRNGDFERGAEGWRQVTASREVIVWNGHGALAPTGVTAQSGNYLAWIGGIPSGEFTMYRTRLEQDVAIPADALSLTFSGYVWAQQPEPGLPAPDWAILEVVDPTPGSSFLWRVQYWEDSATPGWVYFEQTSTDIGRFAGRTVPVQVLNMPNGNGRLSIWLDSLRLEATCAR